VGAVTISASEAKLDYLADRRRRFISVSAPGRGDGGLSENAHEGIVFFDPARTAVVQKNAWPADARFSKKPPLASGFPRTERGAIEQVLVCVGARNVDVRAADLDPRRRARSGRYASVGHGVDPYYVVTTRNIVSVHTMSTNHTPNPSPDYMIAPMKLACLRFFVTDRHQTPAHPRGLTRRARGNKADVRIVVFPLVKTIARGPGSVVSFIPPKAVPRGGFGRSASMSIWRALPGFSQAARRESRPRADDLINACRDGSEFTP